MPTDKQLKDYIDKRITAVEAEVETLHELARTRPNNSVRYMKQAIELLGAIAELRKFVVFLGAKEEKVTDAE